MPAHVLDSRRRAEVSIDDGSRVGSSATLGEGPDDSSGIGGARLLFGGEMNCYYGMQRYRLNLKHNAVKTDAVCCICMTVCGRTNYRRLRVVFITCEAECSARDWTAPSGIQYFGIEDIQYPCHTANLLRSIWPLTSICSVASKFPNGPSFILCSMYSHCPWDSPPHIHPTPWPS